MQRNVALLLDVCVFECLLVNNYKLTCEIKNLKSHLCVLSYQCMGFS